MLFRSGLYGKEGGPFAEVSRGKRSADEVQRAIRFLSEASGRNKKTGSESCLRCFMGCLQPFRGRVERREILRGEGFCMQTSRAAVVVGKLGVALGRGGIRRVGGVDTERMAVGLCARRAGVSRVIFVSKGDLAQLKKQSEDADEANEISKKRSGHCSSQALRRFVLPCQIKKADGVAAISFFLSLFSSF